MAVNRRAPRIEVEIGELLLHGFDSADRYDIAEALRSELTHLVREDGLAVVSSKQSQPLAKAVAVPAEAIGIAAARHAYQSLTIACQEPSVLAHFPEGEDPNE